MKSDLKALFLLLLLVLSIDGKIMSIQQKGSVDI